MKKCTSCKIEKELTEFNKNKSRKDGLNNICRVCSNARSKKYYNENKEHHKKVTLKRKNKLIKENQQKLINYYLDNPCVDCGNDNPLVLECDHRDGVEKVAGVGKLIQNACTWETIEKEINKCDVRCSNCHRIRTAEQQGWYKGLILSKH
jgi:hypothetical protein